MDIKENDFFHFRSKKRSSHCFEGLLRAVKYENGEIMPCDTFWGINDGSGVILTIAEAETEGELKFYCNLNEIEKIPNHERDYYDDKDIFVLTRQHACSDSCIYSFIKKGAQRSKEKMLSTITEKIDEAQRKANCLLRDVEQLTEIKAKIEAGDTTVYL